MLIDLVTGGYEYPPIERSLVQSARCSNGGSSLSNANLGGGKLRLLIKEGLTGEASKDRDEITLDSVWRRMSAGDGKDWP